MKKLEKKFDRLMSLEQLLLSHPEGITRAEIAKRLGVNRSTIGRDIGDISKNVPVWEDENRHIGIHKDSYLNNIRLTIHEITALHHATRLMASGTDRHNPHSVSALRKLGQALMRIAPRISTFILSTADVMESRAVEDDREYLSILETITRSWAEGRKVMIEYYSVKRSSVSVYTLSPYYIEPYSAGHSLYVIGLCDGECHLRTFKLERIQKVVEKDETFSVPDSFDPNEVLHSAWGIWGSAESPQKVILLFSAQVAARVRETRWHRSQSMKTLPDGKLKWSAGIAEPREMYPWIRGWGPDVEVLAPDWLRDQHQEDFRRGVKLYEE